MLIWVSLQPSESIHQHSSKYERTSNYHHRLWIGAACRCKILSNYRDLLVVLPFTDKGITSKNVSEQHASRPLSLLYTYHITQDKPQGMGPKWSSNIAAYLYNARIWKVNGHGWEWRLLWLIECKSSDWAQQWLCLFFLLLLQFELQSPITAQNMLTAVFSFVITTRCSSCLEDI